MYLNGGEARERERESGGEKEDTKSLRFEREEEGEMRILIYRRGVSVIISPSLSTAHGGKIEFPFYPHPSGYRDRTV